MCDIEPLKYQDMLSLEGHLGVYVASDGEIAQDCFVVLSDSKLNIFESDQKLTPFFSYEITTNTKVEREKKFPSIYFEIHEKDQLVKKFKTHTEKECNKWVGVIQALNMTPPNLSMDDFTIISVIGRGYLGKILLVQHNATGNQYAIKRVKKNLLTKSGHPSSVIAERNILMLIQNPFIVQLYFAFQTPKMFYLGLEYAPGGDLFYYLETKGLVSMADARLYTAELAIALEHLHQLEIVYRDLKPENILFDERGHIKLADFGLAKDMCETENTTTFCGTYFFLAPEIVLHQPYSYEVDWWALGVLLCEMLTGALPFEGENQKDLMDAIVNKRPTFDSDSIDDDYTIDLILHLLVKNPAERYTFEQIQQHPFFDSLDWEVVMAKRYRPEYIPKIKKNSVDNFDPTFTSELPVDSSGQSSDVEDFIVPNFSFSEGYFFENENNRKEDSSLVPETKDAESIQ